MTSIEVHPMSHATMRNIAQTLGWQLRFQNEHIGDNVYTMAYLTVPDTNGNSVYKSDNVRCWLLNYGTPVICTAARGLDL